MDTDGHPPVQATGLRKSFRGRLRVDDVSLAVGHGRVTGHDLEKILTDCQQVARDEWLKE